MAKGRALRAAWLVALIGLLALATPAGAAIGPVDPARPLDFLPQEEQRKIVALQGEAITRVISPISPDDGAVLVLLARPGQPTRLGFLSPADGEFGAIVPTTSLASPITGEFVWLDAATIAYLGLKPGVGPVYVTIARASGAIAERPVALPGFPLTLAPTGRQAIVVLPAGAPAGAPAPTVSPFDGRLPSSYTPPWRRHEEWLPGALDTRYGALQVASAGLRLALVDLPGGRATPLYELPPGTAPLAGDWSADGSRFALVRASLEATQAYRLVDIAVQDSLGNLAPADNPFLQTNVVDIVDAAAGTARPAALRAADGDSGQIFLGAAWSPDGRVLLTQMGTPTRLEGRRYPIYGFGFSERQSLRFYEGERLTGTVDDPAVAAPLGLARFVGPDEVIVNTPIGTDMTLVVVERASGRVRRLPLPPGSSLFDFQASPRTRVALFSHSSYLRPTEVYRIGLDGGEPTALTERNAELASLNAVRVDRLSLPLASGRRHEGYLIQPAGAPFPPRDVPIVVWQEGGPQAPVLNRYDASVESPFNLLPNFGVAVLVVPLYGRIGFGVEDWRALYAGRNFGQVDIDAQAEIVGGLIAQGWTRPGRVGISGCSYGGYFVSQSLTRHPDLYASGNTQCTLLDLFSEWQVGFTNLVAFIVGAPPTAEPETYVRISPLYNAARVRGATLIFHGTRDFLPIRFPVSFHDQILKNGAPVNMYSFTDQGHGLANRSAQLSAAQLQLAWFRQNLR